MKKDITGQRFGKLIALEVVGVKHSHTIWKCKCDCGNHTEVDRGNLTKKKGTNSCGCISRSQHGLWKSLEYSTWKSMLKRCYYKKHINYSDYGGRGITVCDRWKTSILNFIEDMGNRPSKKYSIDRIDNDGHYEPENCRWADKSTQSFNQKKSLKTSSKYFGVRRAKNKWRGFIMDPNTKKSLHLGMFENEKEAALVYNKKAIEFYGNKAKLNKV